jgi:hypothetical protein
MMNKKGFVFINEDGKFLSHFTSGWNGEDYKELQFSNGLHTARVFTELEIKMDKSLKSLSDENNKHNIQMLKAEERRIVMLRTFKGE